MPLLDIRNLTIEFKTGDEWVKAVDRVSMTLTEGEIWRKAKRSPSPVNPVPARV